jgi:formylglycine-generating enzyme required for sulfatase activity
LLQKAVSHGYDNYTHMRQDADLDSIREHADFVELMKAGSLTLNLRYSAVWNSHPGFTSMELHGLSPSDHLRECAQLSQDGCRVVAISAAVVDGELLTASVWHRPAGEFQFPERVETKSEQARSLLAGLCLAVGNVTDLVGAKDDWKSLASVWFTKSPDSGTHSAASWTLRQWDVELPAIKATAESPQDRHWQVTKTGLTLVHFPAGQFELDDGKTKQPVTLTRGFWLCDREVSVGSFQQFMDDEEYLGRKPKDWEGADVDISPSDEHPVQQVSWEDAVLFCNWLSWREGLEPCYEVEPLAKPDGQSRATLQVDWLTSATGYRLPTESEWEYACRGGATTEFCLGDDTERLRRYAVYGATKSEAVGNHLCNRHGLFDMHGNVYEWCYDWYGERESTLAVDPSGSSQGSVRVVRGGCWNGFAGSCQSGYRDWYFPSVRSSSLGFRVARGPSPSKPVSGAESGSR